MNTEQLPFSDLDAVDEMEAAYENPCAECGHPVDWHDYAGCQMCGCHELEAA